eukprot:1179565-Prorocentrum_minimum.AAC.1
MHSTPQASDSLTREYGGTGLGLSMVKTLVTAHHGTITCTSTVGKGSTFVFTLRKGESFPPVKRGGSPREEGGAGGGGSPLGGVRGSSFDVRLASSSSESKRRRRDQLRLDRSSFLSAEGKSEDASFRSSQFSELDEDSTAWRSSQAFSSGRPRISHALGPLRKSHQTETGARSIPPSLFF